MNAQGSKIAYKDFARIYLPVHRGAVGRLVKSNAAWDRSPGSVPLPLPLTEMLSCFLAIFWFWHIFAVGLKFVCSTDHSEVHVKFTKQ